MKFMPAGKMPMNDDLVVGRCTPFQGGIFGDRDVMADYRLDG